MGLGVIVLATMSVSLPGKPLTKKYFNFIDIKNLKKKNSEEKNLDVITLSMLYLIL